MSLRAQVVGGLVLLVLLATGLAAYQLALMREMHDANQQLASIDLDLSRSSLRVGRLIGRLSDLTQRYVVLADPRYRDELGRVREEIDGEIAHLVALPLDDMGPSRALWSLWDEYVEVAHGLESAVSSGANAEALGATALEALSELQELARRLDNRATIRAAEVIAASTERADSAHRVTVIVAAVGIAFTAGLAIWLGHSVAGPLRALTQGTEALATGEFSHRVDVVGPTGLRELAHDFNTLAQRLGELDRMKRDFLSTVSHDLKAPLSSIQETTRLLLEDDGSKLTPDHRHLLELSMKSAHRLQEMIVDLLDIARLEGDSVAFQLETLDLSDCCELVAEQAAEPLAHKGLQVDFQLEKPLPIRADARLFPRALSNLLSNAIKYSPRDSTLELTTESARTGVGPAAILKLRDHGPGVPDRDKELIFDRFYCSRARAERPAGTGLGLAIARSVIEHHAGRVWVEDAPGGGSVFLVHLPLTQRPGPDPAETHST